jgi:hypothetical protein
MSKDNINPVIKRIAVKADCVFAAPALIGSGFGEQTDSDILRDRDGHAFLPGSSVAGALLALAAEFEPFKEQDRISPLWFYDAELKSPGGECAKIIELDGVALEKENKVADEGKKYDYEAVDTGTEFALHFLLTIRALDKDSGYEELLQKLLGAIKSGGAAFGAKTRRGFGRVNCERIQSREFDLSPGNIDVLDAWLKFDRNTDNGWDDAETAEFSGDYATLTATLNIDGSIMIRDTKNIYEDLGAGEKAPDYKHISVDGKAAILGTSWAGSFRSGLYRLLSQKFPQKADQYLNDVFGFVKQNGAAAPSKVVFGASYLTAENPATDGYRDIMRVKIDRFTGGAADGALFFEKPWYGGKTALEVRYPKDREDIRELILLGFDALGRGIIQIGGETAVGRGFVKNLVVYDNNGQVEISGAKPELKARLENLEKEDETA